MINYHFHDERSSDAVGALAEHCAAAAERGVAELCVTNHVERLAPDGTWSVNLEDAVARFSETGRSLEEACKRWPGLVLRLGAELEYRPEWTGVLEELAERVPFDFLIGSVHQVDGLNISGGSEVDAYFAGRSLADAYGRYFETVLQMVEWGGFDVVGHFDLIKRYGHLRYGPYAPATFEPTIRATLSRMGAAGIGIEINTSGCVQAPGVPYPEPQILEWALEAGVRTLTIGTDSHAPGRFDQGLQAGFQLARSTGWKGFSRFEGRRVVGSGAMRTSESSAVPEGSQ